MNAQTDREILPESGIPFKTLLEELEGNTLDPIRGHFARAFRPPEDVQELSRRVYDMFISDNGIFSLRAPYMQKIESEVIDMCLSLLHPPPGAAGNFTSGGSESNYSALHAMREWAGKARPDVEKPEVIAPYSAHPTFSKGCHYFGLNLTRTQLGADRRADVAAMEHAITSNTVGLVASAPCWTYGLYDPVDRIAELAASRGLWLHVDACVGGYLGPFAEQLGYALPPWDFRCPGVMSISADLHKFGYCPKPASTVFWRDCTLQEFHYVHPDDWPGGTYRTAGFSGTRSAGPLFAAWTVLQYLGREGYLKLAQKVFDIRQRMTDAINAIDGLKAWQPDLLPLPFSATDLNLEQVMGGMVTRGWTLLGAKEPPLIDIPIDAAVTEEVMESFIGDLRDVVEDIREARKTKSADLEY